jgi:hypothetical protein
MTKYYKTIVTITILSEEVPPEWNNLKDIDYLIDQGHCSGMVEATSETEVTAKEMAQLLMEQNTDTEFFNLDEEGNKLNS